MKKTFSIIIASSLTIQLKAQSPDQSLLQELFTTRDSQEFSLALKKAQKVNLPPQALLEAKFLYYVDRQDYQELAELTPALKQIKFSASHSEIFTLEDDWLAITKYCEALQALHQKDFPNFKKSITEAFWLSPRQASAFSQHIEEFKLDQAMAKLTLDTSQTLPNLFDEKTSTLFEKDKTATLLYFWSPWSREFVETIDDYKRTNAEALKHNFHIVSILAEEAELVESDAKALIKDSNISTLSNWVKETQAHTLSQSLRIQNIPTLVLINNQGKVLFNGHPSNPKFWRIVSQLSPKFTQPNKTIN
ncbi:thioredoxin family protein [Rubritalea spongiae]|uniref:Thioredoxin family protein n=1 Tax=Rubritalea spongiae TaxID=430797 RepID=A0ABW5E6E0_9BACT